MKNDNVYIGIILDSIRKIEDFTNGVDKEKFLNDEMMRSAVIMQLVVIGEESNRIGQETKSKIDLRWREILDFRNMAVHEYMKLNLDIVWDTIQQDIPELKTKLLEYK
jgi:uncharacterized protein with HEPN domain